MLECQEGRLTEWALVVLTSEAGVSRNDLDLFPNPELTHFIENYEPAFILTLEIERRRGTSEFRLFIELQSRPLHLAFLDAKRSEFRIYN